MERFIIFVIAVLTLMVSCVLGEIAPFQMCDASNTCTVSQVRITPCKEGESGQPCKVKKSKTAEVEIDFSTKFNSNKLQAKAYWANGLIDLPFVDLEKDACKTTTCPLVENHNQTYKYGLTISKLYPLGTYKVKWELIGDDNEKCCIYIKIKIVR